MKREVVAIVEAALNSSVPVLVLRGIDSQARDVGDLDFLVPKRRKIEACQRVASAAAERGWRLLRFRDIGYLATIVLARPTPGGVDSVKLDFFSGLDWYAAGSAGMTDRFFQLFVSVAKSDDELRSLASVVNWFQKCMTNGRLSARDLARVREGGASPRAVLEVATALNLPVPPDAAETGQLTQVAKWKLRAASGGAHEPWGALAWFARAVLSHIRFKAGFGTHAGILLAVAGIDGSGKSTALERLTRAYDAAAVLQYRLVHLLPNWIPMPHELLRRKKTSQNYTRPYSEAPVESRGSAALRLVYYLCAFVVSKAALWFSVLRGQIVVMDRSFVDFVADLARAKIPHRALPRFIIKACAPAGRLVFIDAKPETVVRRKGELSLAKAAELRGRYQEVTRILGATVIDGEGTQDAVFAATLGCVDAWYRSTLMRLSDA